MLPFLDKSPKYYDSNPLVLIPQTWESMGYYMTFAKISILFLGYFFNSSAVEHQGVCKACLKEGIPEKYN